MSTAFDTIEDAFATKLAQATAVCAHILVDEVEPLPAEYESAINITLVSAEPQQLGLIDGNPIDWITQIHVRCYASAKATSPRPAANTLAGAAYARLAADPSLGIAGVYIGEPTLSWEFDQAATRMAICVMAYNVQHRTSGLTLA